MLRTARWLARNTLFAWLLTLVLAVIVGCAFRFADWWSYHDTRAHVRAAQQARDARQIAVLLEEAEESREAPAAFRARAERMLQHVRGAVTIWRGPDVLAVKDFDHRPRYGVVTSVHDLGAIDEALSGIEVEMLDEAREPYLHALVDGIGPFYRDAGKWWDDLWTRRRWKAAVPFHLPFWLIVILGGFAIHRSRRTRRRLEAQLADAKREGTELQRRLEERARSDRPDPALDERLARQSERINQRVGAIRQDLGEFADGASGSEFPFVVERKRRGRRGTFVTGPGFEVHLDRAGRLTDVAGQADLAGRLRTDGLLEATFRGPHAVMVRLDEQFRESALSPRVVFVDGSFHLEEKRGSAHVTDVEGRKLKSERRFDAADSLYCELRALVGGLQYLEERCQEEAVDREAFDGEVWTDCDHLYKLCRSRAGPKTLVARARNQREKGLGGQAARVLELHPRLQVRLWHARRWGEIPADPGAKTRQQRRG